MSRQRPEFLATVFAVWLITDLWRMFTPSLITLFGRAAESPPELMGGYALTVMAAPLLPLAFVKRSAPKLATWLLIAAFTVRLGLRANPQGADIQLYGSSLGVTLAVTALCLLAGSAARALVPAAFVGVAVAASTHAALGTFGAVWRTDPFDIALLITQALLLAAAARATLTRPATPPAAASARTGLLLFPALLLLQLALSNVGRGNTTLLVWGSVAVVLGAWLAVAATALPTPTRPPRIAVTLLVAAVATSTVVAVPLEVTRDGIEGQLSLWALAAFAIGPPALARLLALEHATGLPRRTALTTGLGAVIWTVTLFLFYAGYDLGYRADWAVVALALIVSITAAWPRRTPAAPKPPRPLARRTTALTAVAAAVSVGLAILGPAITIRPLANASDQSVSDQADELTVAAYNLRMGYAIDGTFDPIGVARQIKHSGAQLVLLSEVDRGWLLNGGQDQLAILARLLSMHFVFGPAGDQVWGDVILSKLPLEHPRSAKLPAFDSLTGAAMPTATVTWHGNPVQIIATHLQPDADGDTTRQAEAFAAALSPGAARGAVIGGGDLNTTPGSAAWRALQHSGAADALAAVRPAPTWSAEAPSKEIDHLFVRGLEVVRANVTRSPLSDHLMIQVTVR